MGSGSTILARQNNEIYIPILIALIIAIVVVIIFFILKKIHAIKKSPEYIEKQKNRVTKRSDIKNFKAKYNLSQDETMMITNICEDCKPKNINFLIYDSVAFDNLFRQEYNIFRTKNVAEEIIADFFQLRYKLEQNMAQTRKLASTVAFPEGAIVFYIDKNGEQFPLTLQKNEKSFMMLEVPDFIITSRIKPEELKKAKFMYISTEGMTYLYTARPIRYTTNGGTRLMVTSHSTNLTLQTQRQTKREFVKADCKFASVKEETVKGKTVYTNSENKYPAKLINVSAGGCCLHTNLPIKEQQLLSIYYPELLMNENTVGIIKNTRVIEPNELYALHIQFIKINLEVQNKIYAFVYKYEL